MIVLRRAAVPILLFAGSIVGAVPARAQFQRLTSPAQINAPTMIFGNFPGASGDPIPSPFSLTNGGNTATFTALGSPGFTRFESDANATVDTTAFPAGSAMLETFDPTTNPPNGQVSGPLQVSFASGVRQFGLFAEDTFSDTEQFTVTAFSGTTQIGSFTTTPEEGDNNADPHAVFLGGQTTNNALVTRFTVSSVSTANSTNDFYIGAVRASIAAVPEPSLTAAFALGFIGLGGMGLRSRRGKPVSAVPHETA